MKYISYLRVSTQKQGTSGLGLQAQREIIKTYLKDTQPTAEFIEVESGRKTDTGRPQLHKALEQCRNEQCTLIVAKLDRLARNVAFLSALLDSNVEIVFCDFPMANKMVLQIVGAISQYEAELISTRTRQALQAKKAQGAHLGNPSSLAAYRGEAIKASTAKRTAKAHANDNNRRAKAMIRALQDSGLTTRQIADQLNATGFKTSQGGQFYSATVSRIKRQM